MEITWHGHSAIRLLSRDVSLLTDPHSGLRDGPDADIVAVSCEYPSHSDYRAVGGEPRALDGPGQYEALGYNITGIGTALNDSEGSRRINTIYVIRSEGLAVCHLGCINARLTSRQLESLGTVDVLVVPSGGSGALETGEIARLVSVLSPGIVIPVHYSGTEDGDSLGSARALLSAMNVEPPDTQIRINVTQSNIPRQTRVVLLRDLSGG